MPEQTPMMLQYRRIKSEHRDAVLFFRLGDFYEMFDSDAREVSRLLNLTLTSRHGIPMCGIPYHAAGNYIPRLLNAGKKIAICEQTTLPQKGRTLVEREVVEVITPGTIIDEGYLAGNRNNYIVSIGAYGKNVSFVYLDLSTAEFGATSITGDNRFERIKKEIFSLNPSEIIIQESFFEENSEISRLLKEKDGLMINRYPDWKYDFDYSFKKLTGQLGTTNLKAFGLDTKSTEIFAVGVLLEYVEDTSRNILAHLKSFHVYGDTDYLGLDEATQKNLEIITNMQSNTGSFTLVSVVDKTKTAMGARKIRNWLLRPLTDRKEINFRLEAVDFLYHNQLLLNTVRDTFKSILDIQRLTSKIALDKAHAKDLVSLSNSLKNALYAVEKVTDLGNISNRWIPDSETTQGINKVINIINSGICDEPSVLFSEGNLIRSGYSSELDKLKELKKNSRQILDGYLDKERKATGITNLKIKYNKIIGYFFEVTKTNTKMIPDHFIRRQSLVNNERFTTEELGRIESELNSATEKALELEKKLFFEIRTSIKNYIRILLSLSEYISDIDCVQAFAYTATVNGYIKPEIKDGYALSIVNGRHPVVEYNLPPGEFVPNSIDLNEEKSFALITGPNMAGKSTYLRQTALIVLLAQAGSFVPAESAEIGVTDRIFCRVGASDNLARGESTFLVEMNETAYILQNATRNSLVIMDEVGRGTGTNDGLAIAWAVSEYLINLNVKTLFATHYHELTAISRKGHINLHLDVLEKSGEIVFLKKVIPGSAGNSYGIHVAKLAGIPEIVIQRANSVLSEINNTGIKYREEDRHVQQDVLFSRRDFLESMLSSVDINRMTPLEALNFLHDVKRDLEAD